MEWMTSEQWRDSVKTAELWPGDRVMWRKVAFTVHSTWQDGTVDLWDADNHALIEKVEASELEAI